MYELWSAWCGMTCSQVSIINQRKCAISVLGKTNDYITVWTVFTFNLNYSYKQSNVLLLLEVLAWVIDVEN